MITRFAEAQTPLDYGVLIPSPRQASVLAAAQEQDLLGAKDRTIGCRVPSALVDAAKARSGIRSDSDLMVYALSKVAIEDNFAATLLALKGSVPKDMPLDV
jgi:hypothetical protein